MKQKGIALVTALIFTVVIVVLVTVASIASLSNRRSAADNLRTSQSQFAAEAGLDRALDETWYKVKAQQPATTPLTIAGYQALLNSVLSSGSSKTFPSTALDANTSYLVTVSRQDNTAPTTQAPNTPTCAVLLTVDSTGQLGTGGSGGKRKLEQNFCITGQDFKGLDYALLTNNANCIFCHMQTQSLDALGGAASTANPWRKTKLGSLQTIEIRQGNDFQSTVAGTVQTRGQFLNSSNGSAITDGSQSTLKSLLNPGAANITNSSTGSNGVYTSPQNLTTNVDCLNNTSSCTANQNFYFNYPTSNTVTNKPFNNNWPDGQLPDSFPPPVKKISPNSTFAQDFSAAIAAQSAGTDKDNPAGTITGGNIGVISSALSGQPSWSSLASSGQTLSSGASGNVVLDGSSNPISCGNSSDGTARTIYIQGDLIIRGKIKGTCKIVTQGNIYVMGDLQYVCGSDNHLCTNSEYANPTASKLPAVALLAGKNMMVGDYLTPRLGNIVDSSVIDHGYSVASNNTNNTWGPKVGASTLGTVPSMAWREMALFNRDQLLQYQKSGGSYTPRFYTMRDYNLSGDTSGATSQIPFWTGSGDEGVDSYTNSGYVKIPRSCITSGKGCVGITLNGQTVNASTMKSLLQNTLSLSPTLSGNSPWIGESALKNLWIQSVENTTRGKKALRTDGLLYSSNAIISIAKCCTEPTSYNTVSDYTSNTQGQWDVRGSIIAADTGILVTGNKPKKANNNTNYGTGLNIYHDYRLNQFFKIQDQQTPGLYRSAFKVKTLP